MSNALALVYAMGSVTLLALLGLFCELLTGVVRRWWRRRRRRAAPTLALKPKADRDNPLMEGCEPVEMNATVSAVWPASRSEERGWP